jgi:hypothetical protein
MVVWKFNLGKMDTSEKVSLAIIYFFNIMPIYVINVCRIPYRYESYTQNIYLKIIFCSARDQTQDARHMLYHRDMPGVLYPIF